jgi:tripartite-type tricarboxylate transporter receptor subunit TctC
MSTIEPHHLAGRVRGIAVTGQKRTPGYPDIPTIAESGLPGYDVTVWAGLITPVGVSKAVIARLNQAVNQAMVSPSLMEKYAANGVETVRTTPEEFGALIKHEVEKYTALAKSLKLKVD